MLIRSRRPTPLLAIAGLSALLGGGFAPPSFAADNSAPAAEAAAPKTPQFLTALASSSSWDDFISSSWGKDPEPTTTKDPQIALDDLELLLAPMAKDDIKAEAKGWFALVQAKEREISVAELNVRRKNREIALLEKQKAAAAELAKASQDVKAAGESGDGSDKDKAAAAARLAEAQKALVKTVETANKETAKEDKKAEATAASMAKQADASPPPASATGGEAASASAVVKVAVAAPAASDKDVLQKAADAAAAKAQQSGDAAKGAEKVDQVVAASAKEAEASEKVKSLVEVGARGRQRRGGRGRRCSRRCDRGCQGHVGQGGDSRETDPGGDRGQGRRQGAACRLQHAAHERAHRASRPLETRARQVGGQRRRPEDLSHVHRLARRAQDRRLGPGRDLGAREGLAHRGRGRSPLGA